MITVLLPPGAGRAGSTCRLDDDEAHHLRVRRAEDGEAVSVRDGAGLVGSGRAVREGEWWSVEIESAQMVARPPDLILAVGAGDRDRFEWLVEKASELGVTSVVPVETARTAGVATKLKTRHLDKLRRQALEAVKQSGTGWATAVHDAVALDLFVSAPRAGILWLADEVGSAPPATLDPKPVTVVVGPEGGLTVAEREAVMAAGYHAVRLGAHTLRFETAAIASAAAVTAARIRGTDG